MELSIREAKARFSEAAAAASRGERVVVTKQGLPFIEWIPAQKKRTMIDWEKLRKNARDLGIDGEEYEWPEEFDDPAFSRRVLGLED